MLQLSELESDGRGDCSLARQLEDESEVQWIELSAEQQQLIRSLSADLWFLSGDCEVLKRQPRPEQEEALRAARRAEHWQEVAMLLHDCPALAVGSDGLQIRAELWSALGQVDVARRFYARLELEKPGEGVRIAARRILERQGALSGYHPPHRCRPPLFGKVA
jgi:hypothetical protein